MRYRRLLHVPFMAVITIITVYVLISCAPSARIPVTRPAEINLKGIKQIWIGEIRGNAGEALSERLTGLLFESNHFKLVDRANIEKILKEQNLGLSGVVDEETAVEMGKILGASAFITGRSGIQFNHSHSVSEIYLDSDNQPYQYYYSKTEAHQDTILKVIDMTTGQVIAAKNISYSDKDDDYQKGSYPPYPDRSKLFGRINHATALTFTRMIAPYTVYVKVRFKEAKTPEGEAGIALAQSGEWLDALEQFKLAVDKDPASFSAWFNLGLAYEYNYMYDRAISALKESCKLKASSRCINEIKNVKKLRADQEKLKLQKSGQ